jgi:predicted DNA-binding WGR domain protein
VSYSKYDGLNSPRLFAETPSELESMGSALREGLMVELRNTNDNSNKFYTVWLQENEFNDNDFLLYAEYGRIDEHSSTQTGKLHLLASSSNHSLLLMRGARILTDKLKRGYQVHKCRIRDSDSDTKSSSEEPTQETRAVLSVHRFTNLIKD